MTITEWILFVLVTSVMFPWIVYITTKLVVFAFYRGRFLAEKENQNGGKSDGDQA